MVAQYSLDDYAAIQSSPSPFQLPPSIHTIIQKLILDLGVSYTTTTTTTTTTTNNNSNNTSTLNHDSRHYRDRHGASSSSASSASSSKFKKSRIEKSNRKGIDTTWEKQAEFIATKILKKEGIEKLINEIRVSLNKISTKNYETHRDTIFKNINDIIDHEQIEIEQQQDPQQQEQIDKIAAAIFEIASTNKFYSVLYATLYKELTEKYPIFTDILQNFITTTYLNNINSIEYVDEQKDYDKFCLINKENDRRKAMSVFIINLMKKELVPKHTTVDIITHLQDLVMAFVDQPDKNYVVDEITENIFLLLTTCEKDLIHEPGWDIIVNNIQTCSQYKVKEHQSISSRAIFKYKDIVDVFKRL